MRIKLAIALLLFSTAAFAADRRVHKTIDLSAGGHFSLKTHNGTVSITTWNQPRVDIAAVIEDVGSQNDVDKTDVRFSGSGSDVRVETNYDAVPYRNVWFGTSRELPPVHYTISLPATASVNVDDHNADVRINGLQADVRVSAHNGRVVVENHGGAADIDAHNAAVRVAFTRFDRASSIETHNGDIEVRLPAAARFNVNASGHHLGVDSDFPIAVRRMQSDEYVGGVNGGGPELRIETHNGGLALRRS